jgi:hypothetical protein
MVNAQKYVFYFEFDTAKVFPFRPSCSSYDSERKKSQKVSQKGPEKKVNAPPSPRNGRIFEMINECTYQTA